MANNYMMPLVNPTQAITQSMQTIQGIRDMRATRDARQLAAEQAAQAQAAAAEQAEAARIQAQATAEEQARIKAELGSVYQAAMDNPTEENFMKLSSAYAQYSPEKAKAFTESWSKFDTSRQQADLRDSVNLLTALEVDKDFALSMLQTQVDAANNAVDVEESKKAQTLINMINVGPQAFEAVKRGLIRTIGMMPGGDKALAGAISYAQEQRTAAAEPTVQAKRLADIGLTEAQTNKVLAETKLLGAETTQLIGELEAAKASGGLDPEKKFNSELALNKEYTTRTKGYEESLRLNEVIKSSAASNTGAGDLALINTFMKMLDPGSVVRESEFAQAQDTAGLVSKLAASLGRVQSGQVLVPAQRTEFARLADQYMKAAAVQEKKVRDGLELFVKDYGLNAENVFGTMASSQQQTTEVDF